MNESLSHVYNPLFLTSAIVVMIGLFLRIGFPHPIAVAGARIALGSASIILAIAIIMAAISMNRQGYFELAFGLTTFYWFVAEVLLFLGAWIILPLWVDKETLTMPFRFLAEEGNGLYRILSVLTVLAIPVIGNLATRDL